MSKTYKFQFVGDGKHTLPSGQKISKGDVLESAKRLDKAFPDRFKRIKDVVIDTDTVPVKKIEKKVDKEEPTEKVDPALAARGTEVTKEFKLEKGLQVFERDGKFHVFEEGKTSPLNKKALKKTEVESFVTKWLSE